MSAARIAAIVLIAVHHRQRAVARRALSPVGIVLAGLFTLAGPASAQSRGELLYTTHCIACHSTQMHWRDQRRATDMESLKEQVRLWQGRALLSWTEDDIVEVTRYLNQSIYRFGQATVRASLDP
jgi:mono/diheme cytochrome c family protein